MHPIDVLASLKVKTPRDKEMISSRPSQFLNDKIILTPLLNELTQDKETDSSISSILP